MADDSDVLKLVSAMLTSSGYTVLTAGLLSEALQVSAESHPTDLLLCDMVLKQDDGPTVAQEFLRVHPGVPVIFMSAYTEHPVLRQEGFGETTPFLQKPFSRDALTHKIRSLLSPARQA